MFRFSSDSNCCTYTLLSALESGENDGCVYLTRGGRFERDHGDAFNCNTFLKVKHSPDLSITALYHERS